MSTQVLQCKLGIRRNGGQVKWCFRQPRSAEAGVGAGVRWADAGEIRHLSHSQGSTKKTWIRSRARLNNIEENMLRWPGVTLRRGQAEGARGHDLHRHPSWKEHSRPLDEHCVPTWGSQNSVFSAFDKIALRGCSGWSGGQKLKLADKQKERWDREEGKQQGEGASCSGLQNPVGVAWLEIWDPGSQAFEPAGFIPFFWFFKGKRLAFQEPMVLL